MRRPLWILLSVLLLAAAWFLVATLDHDERSRDERSRLAALALGNGPARPALAETPAPRAALEADGAAASKAKSRQSGVLEADPETLVALCGRVVDEQSGLGVEGMRLSFLSRRPRTAVVETGPDGSYCTECVLSCGVVSVMHLPDPGDPRFDARWTVEPAQFLLRSDVEAPLRHLDISVRSPAQVLEVQVAHADGSAGSASNVSLVWGDRSSAGGFDVLGRDFQLADAHGRARFALAGEPPEGRLFELEAEFSGGEVSDALALTAPLVPRPNRLDLYTGGSLTVRCTNDRGEPLAGVSLWLASADPSRAPRGRVGDTDASGEFRFAPLASGCWSVHAVHPLTGESVLGECDLPRGAQRTLGLQLGLANLQPGVRGVVLDELDRPLGGVPIRVRNGNSAPVTIQSGAEGRFEYWGLASAGIELSAGPGFLDDDFVPPRMEVPFGTSGVQIRRAGHDEPLSYAVECVSRDTGERVGDATLRLLTEEPLATEQRFSAPGGVTQILVPRSRHVLYAVEAAGYKAAQGELSDAIEARRGGVLRLELEPGFQTDFEVRDRVTRRAIEGARVWLERVQLASSDAQGHVHVELDEWPAALRIECAGYALREWDPRSLGERAGEVLLEPLSPR
ncbi:MAG: hypothetical protein IPJ19_12740 [Planctomycetes bacterium]|nr:hypothetical protein [Planctomycetota bacterium]